MLYYLITFTSLGLAIGLNDCSNKPNKIVSGEVTTIEEHPYQVSIQVLTNNGFVHHCGGSLLKLNVVLTAGHCMTLEIGIYRVRAGSTFISYGGQLRTLLGYVNHPKYKQFDSQYDHHTDYDISILKLSKQFVGHRSVRIIQVQPKIAIPSGTMATIAGWGKTSELGQGSETLMKLNVLKVNQRSCRNIYIFHQYTSRMTCYGLLKEEKGTCQGDSGSPLVIGNYQVGIVSWTIGCARPNYPGVYTDLANNEIRNFIFQHIYQK